MGLRRAGWRIAALSILAALLADAANAACTVPNTLTNGQTADAGQVMANFNAVAGCVNSQPAGATNSVQINAGSGLLGPVGPLTNGQLVIGSTGNAPPAPPSVEEYHPEYQSPGGPLPPRNKGARGGRGGPPRKPSSPDCPPEGKGATSGSPAPASQKPEQVPNDPFDPVKRLFEMPPSPPAANPYYVPVPMLPYWEYLPA